MRKMFNNIKFKNKVTIILTVQTTLLIIFGIIGLNISTYIYGEQLYAQAARVVYMLSSNVDQRLKQISKLSFNFMSDAEVQNQLQQLSEIESQYEQYQISQRLREKMLKYSFMEDYISSISVVDLKGYHYVEGVQRNFIGYSRLQEVLGHAEMGEGGNVWVEPYDKQDVLLSVRKLRTISNMSLAPIGTLIISLDQNKMMEKVVGGFEGDRYYFNINAANNIIAEQKNGIDLSDLKLETKGMRGYFLKVIDSRRYLIVYSVSDYTGWKFLIAMPADNILFKITQIQMLMVGIYLIIFIFVTYIGIGLLGGITRPLEKLTDKMRLVEGDLEKQIENYIIDSSTFETRHKKDEIGRLEQNFKMMVDRINSLLKENYEKKIMLKEWQLKTLQGQINPHFLYNTLDSINWLAKANNQHDISVMVKSLGDLLRYSISKAGYIITIGEEIKILNNYINIQKIRFQDRLNFKLDIDESLWNYKIPNLTFQPIVENSINYALEVIVDVCIIEISAIKEKDELLITISDNGAGVGKEFLEKLRMMEIEPRSSGIGLKNIDERIKIIFGQQYGLSFESEVGNGFKVLIRIPCMREV